MPDAALPGRDRDVDEALAAIRRGAVLELHAPDGTGITGLLRQLAARLDAEGALAVLLRVGRDDPDDVAQRLFDRLYATREPYKPTDGQWLALLEQARPVLLLDEVRLPGAELERLLAALPGCAVVLGTDRPRLPATLGRSRRLEGLTGEVALRVLRHARGRSLTAEERETALRLVDAVSGRPWHLQLVGVLARREGRSLEALEKALTTDVDGAEAAHRMALEALSPPQRQVLAALVQAGGWALPAAAVAAMSGVDDRQLELLHRDRLVTHANGWFAAVAPAAAASREVAAELDADQAAQGLAAWLDREPRTSETALAAAPAAAEVLTWAAERGRWPAVLRLAEPVEEVLLLSGCWARWRRVLEQALAAARAAGDRTAEARCHHQLGVLALCQDQRERARNLLERALTLRVDLADHDGVVVTVDNLRLLVPAATAPAGPSPATGGREPLALPAPPRRPSAPPRRARPAAPALPSLPAAGDLAGFLRRGSRRWVAAAALLAVVLAVPVALGTGRALERAGREPAAAGEQPSPSPATTAPGGPPPGWSAEPTALRFGRVPPGGISGSLVVNVRSRGGGPIGSIEVTGDAEEFRVARTCVGAVVPAGGRCRVQVQFAPSSPGVKRATLEVGFESDPRKVRANLSGQGTAG